LKLCSNISWSTNTTTVAGSSDGTSGADSTMLSSPYDIYVFNDDSLYVYDTFNFRIQSWKANATNGTTVISSAYGSDLNQLSIGQYILYQSTCRKLAITTITTTTTTTSTSTSTTTATSSNGIINVGSVFLVEIVVFIFLLWP